MLQRPLQGDYVTDHHQGIQDGQKAAFRLRDRLLKGVTDGGEGQVAPRPGGTRRTDPASPVLLGQYLLERRGDGQSGAPSRRVSWACSGASGRSARQHAFTSHIIQDAERPGCGLALRCQKEAGSHSALPTHYATSKAAAYRHALVHRGVALVEVSRRLILAHGHLQWRSEHQLLSRPCQSPAVDSRAGGARTGALSQDASPKDTRYHTSCSGSVHAPWRRPGWS